MPAQLDDIFPEQATWPFVDVIRTSLAVTLTLSSLRQHADRRLLELTPNPADHFFSAFFDRMTITSTGLELNRIRLNRFTIDIDPPLVVTTNGERDQVANLLPGFNEQIGPFNPPYDGTVVSKTFKEVPRPAPQPSDFLWEVKIVSLSKERQIAIESTFLFSRAGLLSYRGKTPGVNFIYRRTDVTASD